MKIPYTQEEVIAFDHELHHGELAVANAFKNFLIEECRPQAEMNLVVGTDKLFIKCNKHFNVGETTSIYDIYDTHTNTIRRIHNTETVKIPDLKSFRRYFPTALIHGLDGQTMDKVVKPLRKSGQSVIDIHDAILICPTQATTARQLYADELTSIYNNRTSILENYFNSIGISAAAIQRWNEEVVSLVVPLQGEFKCNPMVLK